MNFLIDVQLPPKLATWLREKGYEARHAMEISGGLTLPDESIWTIARENVEVIVSKDSDFFDKALLDNPPPQLLRITVGNCSNKELFSILEGNWEVIIEALKAGNRMVSVSPIEITVFE